jgi:glucan phosphoethanolaminetransferase (alkaline phosphatase superfamily)
MRRSRSDERHLRQRGDHWHYYRRVPKKYARYDDRGTIRLALGTSSLETA